MRVAVVTPYCREPTEILRRCHDSVARQTYPCTHVMVADGHPNAQVAGWPVDHLILPRSHADNGNTPRSLGAISSLNSGFEAFAFLDADNWLAEDHVESLVAACAASGALVAFSDRHVVLPTGEPVPNDPQDAARQHVDTSCIFITDKAAFLLPVWAMMDKPLSPVCDRVMLIYIRQRKVPHVWTGKKTLFFQSAYPRQYRLAGKPVPPDAHRMDVPAIARAYSETRNAQRLAWRMNLSFGGAQAGAASSGEGSG